MYIFEKLTNGLDNVAVRLEIDEDTYSTSIDHIVEIMERFLRACGHNVKLTWEDKWKVRKGEISG